MAITNIKNMERTDGVGSSPYFDDFNESKNFYRVLYRPGFAVQARELNQMQTLINAQIDRAGQYAFKDGSRVVKGEVTLNNELDYIQIQGSHTNTLSGGGTYNTATFLTDFVGKTIQGAGNSGNQVKAKVLKAVAADASNSAPITLYIKYVSKGGANKTVEKFAAGEEFQTTSGTVRYGEVLTTGATINFDQGDSSAGVGGGPVGTLLTKPIGVASIAQIDEGVYFIGGNYVYVPASEIFLDAYQLASDPSQDDFKFDAVKNKPTYLIGLKVTESQVTSADDSSLNDNAAGTSNASAPGAHRYKISAVLSKDHIKRAKRAHDNFINIMRVKNGIVRVDRTDKTNDTELTKRLATRTFEESGDYSVRPYQLEVKEHLNDQAGNNGHNLASAGGDDSKLVIGIEPNVSYIKGFRNENLTTSFIDLDKPRGASDVSREDDTFTQLNNGNYVKLTTASVKGAPPLDDLATIELHSVNVIGNQVSGSGSGNTEIGTARVRDIAHNASHVELYLFDITMESGQNFSSVQSVKYTDASSSVNDFVGILATAGTRFRTKFQGGVWKLPYNAVKNLKDSGGNTSVTYKIRVRAEDVTAANGKFTVPNSANVTDGGDLVLAVGANQTKTGGDVTVHGDSDTSALILDASSMGFANGTVAHVIFTQTKTSIARTKSYNTNQSLTINVTDGSAQSYGLAKTDVIKINSITDSTGDVVTDRFILDTGQRENIYLVSKIVKKAGSDAVATGNMVVNFDYYSHGASGDYFSVESYAVGTVSSASEIANYKRIPDFNSSREGEVNLRDCIDFRPVMNDNGSGIKNPSGQPKVADNFQADVQYYLPRKDKLIQDINGNFKVVPGVSAERPVAPEDSEDALVIATLDLPAFTFNARNVGVKLKDNKRYTMKDIGNIDKRVKNLEYYTSLSLLEKSAQDTQIFDDGNDERFKNGFLVDGFYGHNVGDVTNPDYNVSIDRKNGILRPKCSTKNVPLIRVSGENNSTSNACDKNGSIVTMDIQNDKVEFASQPYATQHINVNPYDVFSWGGMIKLSPESDEWKEVDVRPDIVIDDTAAFDQFVKMAEEEGILGTVWNEWETNWSGVEIDMWRDPEEDSRFAMEEASSRGFTRVGEQSRGGFNTSVVADTVTKEVGNEIVEVNFLPFMRSIKVFFDAQMLKPNSKVFPFFNGSDISAYVKQEAFQEYSDIADTEDNIRTFEGSTTHPGTQSTLTTDATGRAIGSFIIPRNDILKFKAGTREFRLSDSSTNDKSAESTFAEAQFHSQGLLEVHQKTIVSTKVPRLVTTEIQENRTITETQNFDPVEWVDPLAQTMLIDEKGGIFLTSVDIFFKTKDDAIPVNLSIRSVENGIPTQKIVPGSEVLKYPTETLAFETSGNSTPTTAGDITTAGVATDDTARYGTRFKFDHPIYLPQDQEYAIVLMAQTNAYNVFISEGGNYDLKDTNFLVSKQPYNGVLFTSQNASTWTPQQTQDLKFTANRASFSTTQKSTINLVNRKMPSKLLAPNPFRIINSGSNTNIRVRVTHPNHGLYKATSKVKFKDATAIGSLTAAKLNAEHTVVNIEPNSYEIVIASASAAAGDVGIGGGSAVRVFENIHMDVANIILQNIQLPDTNMKFFIRTYNSKGPDQVDTSAVALSSEKQVLVNRNLYFDKPQAIMNEFNEALFGDSDATIANKSFSLKVEMETNLENISPVIDLNRASVIGIQNIVNDAEGKQSNYAASSGDGRSYIAEDSTTVKTGGSEVAKYITKEVVLNDEATVIRALLNINKPSDANVNLYYKVLGAGSDESMNDIAWTEIAPDEAVPTNNYGQFTEIEYNKTPTDKFGSMMFKIVLRAQNSSRVPKVKDFRVIAAT